MRLPSLSVPLAMALSILLPGCSTPVARDLGIDQIAPRKAEQELSAGIRAYEDGNYKASASHLKNALSSGLAFSADQVSAHKHLAFIYCTSNQEKACRDAFRKALEIDPKFELSAKEKGHPLWGPVFRAVKAETQAQATR